MQARRTAVLVALVAAVIATVVLLTRASGEGTYEVTAVIDNANGLVKTSEVRVAGSRVGTVKSISMTLGEEPRVTMAIKDSYRLKQGARADVRLGSLAGQLNRYIALSNGKGADMADGSTIPLSHTDRPVEIDEVLSALTPKTRDEFRGLLRNTVKTLDGHGPDIAGTLRHSAAAMNQTANLLADVTADRQALSTLVRRASDGAQEVASVSPDVSATIDRLATLLDTTANRRTELTATLRELPPTIRAGTQAIDRFNQSIPTLTKLLVTAGPALDATDPFARQLRRTAHTAPPVFHSALNLIDEFRSASPELARLLARATPVIKQLGPALAQMNPYLDAVRTRAPDALGWIGLLADAAADYDANGHGLHVIGSLRPPVQSKRAADDCGQGWLARPFDRVPGTLACEPWKDYQSTFVGGGQDPASYKVNGFDGEFFQSKAKKASR